MTTHKSLSNVQIKDADKGIVTAVISTFGVIDKDGDVTSKSSFTDGAPVVVSAYGHGSWDGNLPIGKGVLTTTADEAVAELQFFMATTHGRDAFDTIKELSEAGLQEWSYSLRNVKSHKERLDGRMANFIDSVDVKEVSPVLEGASVDTRTLSIKSDGVKFSEQADAALGGIREFVEMAVERLTLRAAEGKSFDEQVGAYDQLITELAPLKTAIDEASTPPPNSDDGDIAEREALEAEYLRFVEHSQGATT